MSIGIIVVCAAAAFASTLSAFVFAARKMGWRYGSIFDSQTPTFLALGCLAFLLGRVVMGVANNELSILGALTPIPFVLFGSMFVHAVLRQNAGMISLVAAPILSVTSVFVRM